jgi:hypothetical protein
VKKVVGRYSLPVSSRNPFSADFIKSASALPGIMASMTLRRARALQAAIDYPAKTTVSIARGRTYQIDQPVYVRGAIRRIIAAGGMLHKANSNGQLIIGAGSAPVVTIEKVSIDNVVGL